MLETKEEENHLLDLLKKELKSKYTININSITKNSNGIVVYTNGVYKPLLVSFRGYRVEYVNIKY